jgi:hypothetical protein
MYFAGNAVATSIVGAISGNLVYEYVKNIFLGKGQGLVWAEATGAQSASEVAYEKLFGTAGTAEAVASSVFNFGNLLVPFIVTATCLAGFFLAYKLPRDFTPSILAKEFKAMDPSLDISSVENSETKPERGEIIFVQVGLSILSFFVFGFIWTGLLLKSVKAYAKGFKPVLAFLLSCFIPFGSVIIVLKARKAIVDTCAAKGKEVKLNKIILILSCLIPLLPFNPVALGMLQHGMNTIYALED